MNAIPLVVVCSVAAKLITVQIQTSSVRLTVILRLNVILNLALEMVIYLYPTLTTIPVVFVKVKTYNYLNFDYIMQIPIVNVGTIHLTEECYIILNQSNTSCTEGTSISPETTICTTSSSSTSTQSASTAPTTESTTTSATPASTTPGGSTLRASSVVAIVISFTILVLVIVALIVMIVYMHWRFRVKVQRER